MRSRNHRRIVPSLLEAIGKEDIIAKRHRKLLAPYFEKVRPSRHTYLSEESARRFGGELVGDNAILFLGLDELLVELRIALLQLLLDQLHNRLLRDAFGRIAECDVVDGTEGLGKCIAKLL